MPNSNTNYRLNDVQTIASVILAVALNYLLNASKQVSPSCAGMAASLMQIWGANGDISSERREELRDRRRSEKENSTREAKARIEAAQNITDEHEKAKIIKDAQDEIYRAYAVADENHDIAYDDYEIEYDRGHRDGEAQAIPMERSRGCRLCMSHCDNANVTENYNSGFFYGNNTGYDAGFIDGDIAGYEKGISDCNSSDVLSSYAKGNYTGHVTGYKIGFFEGNSTGHNDGYRKGVYDGGRAGYLRGALSGNETGYAMGLSEGNSSEYFAGYERGRRDYERDDTKTIIIHMVLASALALSIAYIFYDRFYNRFCRPRIGRCINNVRQFVNNIRRDNTSKTICDLKAASNKPPFAIPLVGIQTLGRATKARNLGWHIVHISSECSNSNEGSDSDNETEGGVPGTCFKVPVCVESEISSASIANEMVIKLEACEMEKLLKGEELMHKISLMPIANQIENSDRATEEGDPSSSFAPAKIESISVAIEIESNRGEDSRRATERDSAGI